MANGASKSGIADFLFPFLEWTLLLDKPTVRADIFAGIAAGVLILPQAIALATLAGLPPEIGLYTAIFPVLICAFYGSSWHSLSGPNTSISLVMVMILSGFATESTPDYVMYAVTLTFMVGVIQLIFGALRLGVVFNYFSHTVMMAIVTGVGIVIIAQQLGDFLGLTANSGEPIEDVIYHMFSSIPRANGYALFLGALTVFTGSLVRIYRPKWPYIIIATLAGLLASLLMGLFVGEHISQINKLGFLSLSALPLSAPDFSPTNFYEAAEGLIMGAFIISFLGLMQSAVIARSVGVRSGQHVNINQEMVGQGLSNIGGSFLSCYPSCGSFNRSASNFDSGAKTPLTGIISALVLGLLIAFAAPLIAQLPMSVVAGVLILVGAGLIDWEYVKKVIRIRGESRIVFLLTLFTVVYGGLEFGVMMGIALSIIVYLRSVSKPRVRVLAQEDIHQYVPEGTEVKDATVLQLVGSIFFGSTPTIDRAFADVGAQDGRKGILIIAGEYIDNMDEAGVGSLVLEAKKRQRAGGKMHFWLRDHRLDKLIENSGLLGILGEENVHYEQ